MRCSLLLPAGKGDRNPVDSVRFYQRDSGVVGGAVSAGLISRDKVSAFIPQYFQERYVRLYTRDSSLVDAARYGFEQWCADDVYRCSVCFPYR